MLIVEPTHHSVVRWTSKNSIMMIWSACIAVLHNIVHRVVVVGPFQLDKRVLVYVSPNNAHFRKRQTQFWHFSALVDGNASDECSFQSALAIERRTSQPTKITREEKRNWQRTSMRRGCRGPASHRMLATSYWTCQMPIINEATKMISATLTWILVQFKDVFFHLVLGPPRPCNKPWPSLSSTCVLLTRERDVRAIIFWP